MDIILRSLYKESIENLNCLLYFGLAIHQEVRRRVKDTQLQGCLINHVEHQRLTKEALVQIGLAIIVILLSTILKVLYVGRCL